MARLNIPSKSKFSFLIVLALCITLLLSWSSKLEAIPFWQGNWQPVSPHREDRGIIKVVWLQGSPYEMGYQQGKLLHDEIASSSKEIFDALKFFGRSLGLARLAMRRSHPEVIAECKGLVDATKDIGLTLDGCMMLAFGDVYHEFFGYALPNVLFNDGCSHFVARGQATVDGHLYFGHSLDNNGQPIDYLLKNPTVFIRQPQDGIPHVSINAPGFIWPYQGMNAAGITIAIDNARPITDELSASGGSNVQTMARILKYANSYAEARDLIKSKPRMRANIIPIADGKSRQAGVFEMTGKNIAVRELDEKGVLYATNHFVSPEMADKDIDPPSSSSPPRYDRLQQLLEPGGLYSRYGKINPSVMVEILRDRINPYTLKASPPHVYDDDTSIASNGALWQVVFDPERLLFWIAAGKVPVPSNRFVCFSLGEMLSFSEAQRCEPQVIN